MTQYSLPSGFLCRSVCLLTAALISACGGVFGDASGVDSTSDSGTSSSTSAANDSGSITLAWIAPTTKADGTPLADLAGFRILLGTASGAYSQTIIVTSPYTLSYTISGLPASTYYAVVKAFDKSNNESAPSSEVSKTIK